MLQKLTMKEVMGLVFFAVELEPTRLILAGNSQPTLVSSIQTQQFSHIQILHYSHIQTLEHRPSVVYISSLWNTDPVVFTYPTCGTQTKWYFYIQRLEYSPSGLHIFRPHFYYIFNFWDIDPMVFIFQLLEHISSDVHMSDFWDIDQVVSNCPTSGT